MINMCNLIKDITGQSRKLRNMRVGPQRLFESKYAYGLVCLILRPVWSYVVTRHAVEADRIGRIILIKMLTDFRMLLFKEALKGYGQVLPNSLPEVLRLGLFSVSKPKGA